jgi:hypothetical protein
MLIKHYVHDQLMKSTPIFRNSCCSVEIKLYGYTVYIDGRDVFSANWYWRTKSAASEELERILDNLENGDETYNI